MGDAARVLQSVVFRRAYKRLHPNQKADVDDAVADIVLYMAVGEAKKVTLRGCLFINSIPTAN